MLKWIGAVLLFVGALGIGNSISLRYRQHYKQLIALKEVLLLLGNEMQFLKMPLPQALKRIGNQCELPYGALLVQIAEKLQQNLEASPAKVWKRVLLDEKGRFLLSEEEYQIFVEAGVILEQANCHMQEEEVRLFIEQVQYKLMHAQEELRTRQRISRYLCGAGGIFLILILI